MPHQEPNPSYSENPTPVYDPVTRVSDAHSPRSVDVAPEFWEQPEVRRAKEASGWPDCEPADFWTTLFYITDAIEAAREKLEPELTRRGITLAELVELMEESKATYTDPDAVAPVDDGTKKAIRRCWVAQFAPGQIASILDVPVEAVEAYVAEAHLGDTVRQISALHAEGLTPIQIAEKLGCSRTRVYEALDKVGEKPHRTRRQLGPAIKARIIDMYLNSYPYAEIQLELMVKKDDVTNTLRAAKRRGELPEYGTRPTS